MSLTRIEWADRTWNPVTGCVKVSPGCTHCYAERFAERFRGVAGHPWEPGFDVTLRPERLGWPQTVRRPSVVFVGSMTDLFQRDVPTGYLHDVFAAMDHADHHVYLVLTKRPARMRAFVNDERYEGTGPPAHIWLGTSVETARFRWRIDELRSTRASVRFVSAEPLLGSLRSPRHRNVPVNLDCIDWVIAGGESGPGARPADPEWARELRDDCLLQRTASGGRATRFFFKQWGGARPTSGGRLLDGLEWIERPPLPWEKRERKR